RSRLSSEMTEVRDVVSRLEIVREAPAAMLRRYLAWPGTQSTVRITAQKRLLRLAAKEHKEHGRNSQQPIADSRKPK
ncbi:MAG: hypothetical protein JWQ04_660, partial [Pedosphaera sp.]|nr:hypothetical protein [Pedosphaera sp.]